MRMLVTPMRRRGVDLTPQERRQYNAAKGDVRVMCVEDERMGRATNLAEVHPPLPMQEKPLSPLYDARLSGMSTAGFVLSGFEVIDGCAYAQSWWCRLE